MEQYQGNSIRLDDENSPLQSKCPRFRRQRAATQENSVKRLCPKRSVVGHQAIQPLLIEDEQIVLSGLMAQMFYSKWIVISGWIMTASLSCRKPEALRCRRRVRTPALDRSKFQILNPIWSHTRSLGRNKT